MMRFALFVTTFNRPERLREVLVAVLGQTCTPETVLVVDNGEAGPTRSVLASLPATRLQYVSMGDNLGPAGAAAFALRRLADQGFEWIAWADDDSPPGTKDTFERLLRTAIQDSGGDLGGVGAIGARFDWQTGRLQRLRDSALTGVVEVDCIGSGQHLITHRRVVDRVGVPCAELFFGFYDPEYCLRVRRAGLRLIVDGDLMYRNREMFGRLGREARRSLIPRNTWNNMWRRYYVTRNYIHMMRRTFGRPDLARQEARRALARSATAWLRGPSYGTAFCRLQFLGVLHGYRGRLGRFILPVPKTYGSSRSKGASGQM